MTHKTIRTGFDQMIAAAWAAGDTAAVDRMELEREYFTNPQFRAWLQDYLAALNQEEDDRENAQR